MIGDHTNQGRCHSSIIVNEEACSPLHTEQTGNSKGVHSTNGNKVTGCILYQTCALCQRKVCDPKGLQAFPFYERRLFYAFRFQGFIRPSRETAYFRAF